MNGRVFLLVAALAAPLLAGCASPGGPGPSVDSPGLVAVAPAELAVGGFYAFRHGGGELVFLTEGDDAADIVLYGGDDRRIGRIGLGGEGAAGRFVIDHVEAGELVVEVRALDGEDGVDIRSAGARVLDFEPLPAHIERHVLLQRPTESLAGVDVSWLSPPAPVEENRDVQLRRAPSGLRLLHHGSYADLQVVVMGEDGVVLRAEEQGSPVQPPVFGSFGFGELPSEAFTENVRDGRLSAQASAADFHGVLVLEAESFSRARAVAADVEPTTDVPRFTYGTLPDQPVSFHVREGTVWLYLLYEGTEYDGICRDAAEDAGADPEQSCGDAALVALFGPDDVRVATVRVPFNQTVAVAAHAAGEWVAVLLNGEATLGADRVPADFEMHPLEVRSADVPAGPASGETGDYGQAQADVEGQGVVFGIAGETRSPTVFQPPSASALGAGCSPASLVALQGGETIGAWGFGEATRADPGQEPSQPAGTLDPNELLDGTRLTVVHDDFGPDCDRVVLVVEGYVR